VKVANDATLLLAAGTPDGWGLAVIAGTGSIAFAKNPGGDIDRAGGWGYLLGDEGSAYQIALGALRAVARSADGVAPPTALTERVLKFMDLPNAPEMIPTVYRRGWDRAAIATMAPMVLEVADAGDAVAQGIVRKEAEELARTAAAAVGKAKLPRNGIPLALAGGVLLGNAAYREWFQSWLEYYGLRFDPVAHVTEPALGAVRIARDAIKQT
jgi:N-acetylglucosamine kinase-like BadF-type ATPase